MHLTLENDGSQADNMQDCWAKKRGVHPDCNGENAEWAKLTEEDVRQIRTTELAWGEGKKLAGKYGVSAQTICDIRKGRTWKVMA